MWTAPELLRLGHIPPEGNQKGDIYSFGIIVHEITTRQGPFYLGTDDKSPKGIICVIDQQTFKLNYFFTEIIELVKSGGAINAPFRPKIDETAFDDINNIMVKCWNEDPAERPDFGILKSTIRKINKYGSALEYKNEINKLI